MRVTVRLSDPLASHVDDVRQDDETSDAEAARECIRRSKELDEVEQRVRELETEVARLNRANLLILEEREEKQELAKYVEDQRSAEQRRREASVVERAKWWLVGMDDVDDE